MDSEFLSGSYRSLLAVDLGRDVGTVLLCLGHYVAAVRGERNSLVHLFLSLENGISGDFFKKKVLCLSKKVLTTAHFGTLYSKHFLALPCSHLRTGTVYSSGLYSICYKLKSIILRALTRRFFRRCPCSLPFTLSNWRIKTSHPALWDCVCDPIALHLPLGGRLDRPRPWNGHLHTTGYMHQTLLRSECFNSFVLLA